MGGRHGVSHHGEQRTHFNPRIGRNASLRRNAGSVGTRTHLSTKPSTQRETFSPAKEDSVSRIRTRRNVGSTTIQKSRHSAKNCVNVTASVDSKSVNPTKSKKSLGFSIATASSSSKIYSTLSNSLAGERDALKHSATSFRFRVQKIGNTPPKPDGYHTDTATAPLPLQDRCYIIRLGQV